MTYRGTPPRMRVLAAGCGPLEEPTSPRDPLGILVTDRYTLLRDHGN